MVTSVHTFFLHAGDLLHPVLWKDGLAQIDRNSIAFTTGITARCY